MLDLVAVLAEPNRRRLLGLLQSGEMSVTALAENFEVTRSAISQHLAVLSDAGLVRARKEGRTRYYELVPEGMVALRGALEMFWTAELEELRVARPRRLGDKVPLEKSVLVPLSIEDTYALVTEPDRLRRWQSVAVRVDLRVGGEYRMTIVPGHTASGKYAEIEPGRRIVFTWGWEDDATLPPGASTVTITLEPEGEGTRVLLVHDGLTDEQAAGHGEGWAHYLERLARAGASGDAGLDEWMATPTTPDPITAAEASFMICDYVLRQLKPGDEKEMTACSEFSVGDLAEHLSGSLIALGSASGAEMIPSTSASIEDQIAVLATQALEGWRRRGIEGTAFVRTNEMPATVCVSILSVELLVHGWDFAQAIALPVVVHDSLGDFVLARAKEIVRPEARVSGRFGPEVTPGPDACAFDRLVAFTGRAI